MKACTQCQAPFEVFDKDREFYALMKVSEPTLCPWCRMIRRLAFRNERNLYHRKCDLTGKQIISAYSPDKPFPVYENGEWWGDRWDPLAYGRDFDFNRPFFDQFRELLETVPRMARIQQNPIENSDYCNAISRSKNCYLIFSSNQDEDCYYGSWMNYCRDCVDNLGLVHCEECYECIDSVDCQRLFSSQECKNCSNSWFLKNCIGCRDCLFCVNLIQRQYCIFNQQYSKEEYEKRLAETNLGSAQTVEALKQKFKAFCENQPVKEYFGTQNENVVGNLLDQCRNAYHCFECTKDEDIRYCNNLSNSRDCMDQSYWGEGCERIYECQANGYSMFNCRFTDLCWDGCSNLTYCGQCFSCSDCFGCIGLKKRKFCIFNRQYSEEEYARLRDGIIRHMRSTDEWGEFFPIANSQYCYNETLAFEQQPLVKEEALARGWKWKDREELYQYQGPTVQIPDLIRNADPSLCDKILTCTVTGRNFKIIPQEFKFHKRHGLPLPAKHPDQRHLERFRLRTPRRLWQRECARCQKPLRTSSSPDRLEKVLCEGCYLKESNFGI